MMPGFILANDTRATMEKTMENRPIQPRTVAPEPETSPLDSAAKPSAAPA